MDKNKRTITKTDLRYRLLATIPTDANKLILGSKLTSKVANIRRKLMETLDGKDKVEILRILVSGIGDIKPLGGPALPFKSTEKTGAVISEASFDLIKEWG